MHLFQNLPIPKKLTITVMVASSFLVSVLAVVFIADKIISFRRNMVENTSSLASVIGINSTAALAFDVPATAKDILSGLAAEPDILTAGILRSDLTIFSVYKNPHAKNVQQVDTQFVNEFLTPFSTHDRLQKAHHFSKQYLDLITPITLKDNTVGYVFLRADLTSINKRIYWFIGGIFLVINVLFVLVHFLCKPLHSTIVKPLTTLTKAVESVSEEQNFTLRISKYNQDEVGILISGFNDMLAQIQKREDELASHRNHLEEMVAQRTQELISSNEKLQREMEERKRAQDQLGRAQKMEAIGTLAAGVAHDLNNVLSGIVSYPQLLLMNLAKDNPMREPIETIHQTGKKAAAIVQDLLTLSRRGVNMAEIVDMKSLVENYLSSPEYNKLMSFHPNVQVITRFGKDILNIAGSPIHLGKCIMNLVTNAAEAIHGGGTISIRLENQFVSEPLQSYDQVKEGDYVVLTVSDTGTGIRPEDIDRIFEPFYTKKKMGRSGTGLGMAVVWGTVKDHNGFIDIKSTLGEGTSISLYFSATREKFVKSDDTISMNEFHGSGESILIVDDVKEQRDIASQVLSFLGYQVDAVKSGESAIDYLEKKAVDLVILDMIMDPGMDGLETFEKIRARIPNQRVIIASGFSESTRVKKAQKLGAGEYIRKPYTLERIGAAVKLELESG